jgi:hypothetical protein
VSTVNRTSRDRLCSVVDGGEVLRIRHVSTVEPDLSGSDVLRSWRVKCSGFATCLHRNRTSRDRMCSGIVGVKCSGFATCLRWNWTSLDRDRIEMSRRGKWKSNLLTGRGRARHVLWVLGRAAYRTDVENRALALWYVPRRGNDRSWVRYSIDPGCLSLRVSMPDYFTGVVCVRM